jgi:hypothetical protein
MDAVDFIVSHGAGVEIDLPTFSAAGSLADNIAMSAERADLPARARLLCVGARQRMWPPEKNRLMRFLHDAAAYARELTLR